MTNTKPNANLNQSRETTLNRLQKLSYVLDSAIPIPGTSYRIGIDPLLGLLPAAGDYLGTIFSAYIVIKATQMGVPKVTLFQMALNIILEMIVGTVPIIGDWFDASWKANIKNIALLETHLNLPRRQPERSHWWFTILLLGGLILVLVATTVVAFILIATVITDDQCFVK